MMRWWGWRIDYLLLVRYKVYLRELSWSDNTVSGTVLPAVEPVDWGPAVTARVGEGLAGVWLPDVRPALDLELALTEQERLEVTQRLGGSQTSSTSFTSSTSCTYSTTCTSTTSSKDIIIIKLCMIQYREVHSRSEILKKQRNPPNYLCHYDTRIYE